jgi:hypothetical protein
MKNGKKKEKKENNYFTREQEISFVRAKVPLFRIPLATQAGAKNRRIHFTFVPLDSRHNDCHILKADIIAREDQADSISLV